jgi:hypothetical protein
MRKIVICSARRWSIYVVRFQEFNVTRNLKSTQEVLPTEVQSPALPANPWGLFFYTLINAAGPISQSWAIGKVAASAAKQAEFSAKEAEPAVRKAEIESEQQKLALHMN